MKPKYLVGYKGRDVWQERFDTIEGARRFIEEIFYKGDDEAIIYELVPVEEKKVKEYA